MTFRRRVAAIVLLSLATLAACAGTAYLGGLRVNLTRSYPLGLWRIDPLGRAAAVGDRLFICPPQTAIFARARERGYLGHGLCPGFYSPLIKTVVAVAGQHVLIDGSVVIDSVRLPQSFVLSLDSEGRALLPATSGVVPPGQLFVFSDFPGSYDSRYFGAIPATGILGMARPIWVSPP